MDDSRPPVWKTLLGVPSGHGDGDTEFSIWTMLFAKYAWQWIAVL